MDNFEPFLCLTLNEICKFLFCFSFPINCIYSYANRNYLPNSHFFFLQIVYSPTLLDFPNVSNSIVKPSLSVVVITYNEAVNIVRCIQSVRSIADEIVVVDSYSSDNTVAIAQSLGAVVYEHAFEGHIQQKNWAMHQAKSEWILSLDGDECLSNSLIKEIEEWKNSFNPSNIDTPHAFWVKRLNHLAGKPIKGCGWYPDKKIRLWAAGSGQWTGTNPHDRFELSNSTALIGRFNGDLLHFTYNDFNQIKQQALKFGRIGAQAIQSKFWGVLLLKSLASPQIKFLKNYFFKRGFLYGKDGWVICYWQWRESLLKYSLGFLLSIKRSFGLTQS